MNTIAYLVYGHDRRYQLELTGSMMTAHHFMQHGSDDLRFVIVCDEQNRRPDLPADELVIDASTLRAWQLDGRYPHAAKAMATAHVLDHCDGKVALVDTDTFFRADPRLIFDRIGPTSSAMHADEGPLTASLEGEEWVALHAGIDGPVCGYETSAAAPMFNSGVIGLDRSHRPLVDDVVSFMSQLVERHYIFTIEQYAFSTVLRSKTSVSFCEDLIEHYWNGPRRYYQYQLAELFPSFERDRFDQFVRALPTFEAHPRPQLVDRLRARVFRLRRGNDPVYAKAYLALVSALRSAESDAALADTWASESASLLTYAVARPSSDLHRDFAAMEPGKLDRYRWMTESTRRAWQKLWGKSGH